MHRHDRLGKAALKTLLITLASFNALGLGLWSWMQQNRSFLPPPDAPSGKHLLNQYQELSHQIWLIILLIAIGYLSRKFYCSRQREARKCIHTDAHPIEAGLRFIRNNPITTALFIAYTVAMIVGTTYLYKDMVGWYPDLIKGYFLDNFATRESFLDETMRRTDYRFFPLAHQDLHILSWFTIHLKTWMLFSAIELIGIVLLSTKFLNNLGPKKTAKQSSILLLTALFLIHPSTGTAFFHVIYCERLLCLLFTLYITTYLSYRQTRRKSYFYLTLLWALLGIYIKDIAIVLFVTPAACLWLGDWLKQRSADQSDHQLEQWLCSLSLVFATSYLVLAFIPSSFAGEAAYNANAPQAVFLDLRCYLFRRNRANTRLGHPQTEAHIFDAGCYQPHGCRLCHRAGSHLCIRCKQLPGLALPIDRNDQPGVGMDPTDRNQPAHPAPAEHQNQRSSFSISPDHWGRSHDDRPELQPNDHNTKIRTSFHTGNL